MMIAIDVDVNDYDYDDDDVGDADCYDDFFSVL